MEDRFRCLWGGAVSVQEEREVHPGSASLQPATVRRCWGFPVGASYHALFQDVSMEKPCALSVGYLFILDCVLCFHARAC
ncbi:UNVERIFIED_CONTAM: hypothetical protein K2H54_053816, partial [Gekko kuhli]